MRGAVAKYSKDTLTARPPPYKIHVCVLLAARARRSYGTSVSPCSDASESLSRGELK